MSLTFKADTDSPETVSNESRRTKKSNPFGSVYGEDRNFTISFHLDYLAAEGADFTGKMIRSTRCDTF